MYYIFFTHLSIDGHLGIYLEKTQKDTCTPRLKNSKRHTHPKVHCSTTYNSQDMEATRRCFDYPSSLCFQPSLLYHPKWPDCPHGANFETWLLLCLDLETQSDHCKLSPNPSLGAQTVRICLPCRRPRFDPWAGKVFWRREWLLISVLLPRQFHGLTEQLTLCIFGLPWWFRQYRICLQSRKPRFDPRVGKIPWRREWQPTPVFLPGEFHGQKSLAV